MSKKKNQEHQWQKKKEDTIFFLFGENPKRSSTVCATDVQNYFTILFFEN